MPRDRSPDRWASLRRIGFVTGTRAEFGLMTSTLRALGEQRGIELQIVATGAHTHSRRGDTLAEIRRDGWQVDAIVPWKDDTTPTGIARAMGAATAKLAGVFARLRTDIVLVVGDRVEAFAAASAAHVSGLFVAHVHGGDRALGQVDDSLRHAISKLAHIHFAATKASGERLYRLGEDRSRIHVVGAPGIDDIRDAARSQERWSHTALLLLHPTFADDDKDAAAARKLVRAATRVFPDRILALAPNSDPGSEGIREVLREVNRRGSITLVEHLHRADFLAALRDCRVLIGNSSSGIIEAGAFGTPVLDVGPRQAGRERGPNVRHVEWMSSERLAAAIRTAASAKRTRPSDNPYGAGGAGLRIARILTRMKLDDRLRRKLIRY